MQKRIRRLPCWWFNNKFLIRDTITFCSYATNFAHSINFWGSQHNFLTIWHIFLGYRGISIKRGKNVAFSTSGTDAENNSYIYSIHYIPASRLKSASTSTKLFASVRIKRPHKPQLTVNNLGLPGRYKSSSINQKKSFGKATRSKFFPINLWTILSYYLYMPMIFVSYSLV